MVKKDGDWWTGKVGDRVGVFPFNYVQPVDGEVRDGRFGIRCRFGKV